MSLVSGFEFVSVHRYPFPVPLSFSWSCPRRKNWGMVNRNIPSFSYSTFAGSAVAAPIASEARVACGAVKLCHLSQRKTIGESFHYTSVPFHAFTLYGSLFSRIALALSNHSCRPFVSPPSACHLLANPSMKSRASRWLTTALPRSTISS